LGNIVLLKLVAGSYSYMLTSS